MKYYRTILLILLFCLWPGVSSYCQDNPGAGSYSPSSEVIIMNSSSVILDRDGNEHVVKYCRDSESSVHITLCTGSMGQSPIHKIDRRRIAAIELDGVTYNISGWSYIGAVVTLNDGKVRRGFIQMNFMGEGDFRSFEGMTDTGPFQVSWKRVKKIDFTGEWQSLKVIDRFDD